MLVPYFRNGGMIGTTLDFTSEEYYISGGSTISDIELISVSVNGSGTIYSGTTVDCSTITANDALIITTQGETGGGNNNNSIVTLTVEGVSATFDRSTTNAAGAAHVSISRIEGSVVAGNASASVFMEYAISLARQSFIFYRLVGGAGAILSDSSENETSGQASISTNVTTNSGDTIISSGYFSNDQNHTFSISNGTLTQTVGVQSGSGSGDAMYSIDATGNVTITYNRSGTTNTQGDAIVAVAYQGGQLGNKKNSGIWDMPAVYDSKTTTPSYSLGFTPSLFNITGTNDAWIQRTVDISAYPGAQARLVFRYQNGGSFNGDIQLDQIDLDGNIYSFENQTHNFETSTNDVGVYASVNWAAIAVEEDNRGRWQVDQGGTPSTSTGRTDAANGTYYVYAETSSPADVNGYNIWLRSPIITLSSNPTLTFFEARNGADIGTLDVHLEITEEETAPPPANDVTPDAVDWSNATSDGSPSGTTNTQTITGINTTITLDVSFTQNRDEYTLEAFVNGVSVAGPTNSPGTLSFNVNNNDTVSFEGFINTSISDDTDQSVATVTNASDGDAVLDTFGITLVS